MREFEQVDKLSWRVKIGFGIGDIFGGGSMVIIGFFYLYFLTDILLIDPWLAGIAFLLSKGFDAITDPIMGYISDRTRSRWGRRRPYFLFGSGLIFLSFTMMWYPIGYASEFNRFIYILCSYLFFSLAYTIVMIPYSALSSELTTNYDERTKLTTVRMFFSSFSSLFCAVAPLEIVKLFSDQRTGYVIMAVAFGLLFAIPQLVVFFMTKERPDFQKEPETFNFSNQFIKPFKTPTFLTFLLMYLLTMAIMDIIMSIMMYYMTYYLGRESDANYVLGVLLVLQIVALPFFSALSARTSKKTSFTMGAIWWAVIMIGSFFLSPGQPVWVIYVFASLVGFGSGGMVIMIYAMMPDVPDVDELYSGKRREGIYSGLITFMRKMSSALGIFLVSQMITFAGFIKPVEQTINGAGVLVKQTQTPEFMMSLRMIFAIVPVAALILCIFLSWRYRLTPEVHSRLNAFLTTRRSGGAVDPLEEAALKGYLEKRKNL